VFEPIPVVVDVRGEPVTIDLMYASGVVGAVPRIGKTAFVKLIGCGVGLDPRSELHIYDLKGGADFDPFAGPDAAKDPTQGIVHAYRSGDGPDDIALALDDLRAMVDDMRRRSKTLRGLPRELCPDSKVTDELASDPKLRLHPVFLFVDECQRWFEHPDHGTELEALATDLVKRGPALGINAWFATQRPDAKSLPPGIRDNVVLRFCLKVNTHTANDMVLGSGMHGAGHTATMFGRKDLGIGILVGEGDDPVIVRADYIDGPAADRIVARARAARHRAGLLTGLSAGTVPVLDDDAESILDHLAEVWPAGEDKVWCSVLAERLADAHPAVYEGWTAEQVTSAVKPHGLTTTQIKRNGRNRNGLDRADLLAVIANRGLTDTDDEGVGR
jgi:S-DNA-T family DNA segregation ATPase FtsK/SpoIIIE